MPPRNAVPTFDTAKWISSVGPQPMETYDSFQNRYGWYRATLHADKAGPVTLHFGGQSGTFIPYLNGQPGTTTTLTYGQSGSLTFPDAHPGDNTLAIFVKASPRSKDAFRELVGMRTARGVWGGVSTDAASTPVDVSWKKWDKATKGADAAALAKPDYDDSTLDRGGSGRRSNHGARRLLVPRHLQRHAGPSRLDDGNAQGLRSAPGP